MAYSRIFVQNRFIYHQNTALVINYSYFLTILLRYNLHTIKFICLRCTFQQLLVSFQSCATIKIPNFKHFYHPKINVVLISSYSPILTPPT